MKPYDVVVFGATGFTGRLVCQYLVARHAKDVRIAIAGRSRDKLLQLETELKQQHPGLQTLGVLQADSGDRAALAALVGSTRVVCTTAGPYALHGEPLLELCAESGTSYCDLTGELQFIRASIDRHHERARVTGARIVHAAGFDSVPSDVAVFMLHEYFRTHGKQLASARAYFSLHGMGFSGGTLSSTLEFLAQLSQSSALQAQALDPYGLVPGRTQRGPDGLDQIGVRYEPRLRQWTGPFIMTPVNSRIVRRTNAMLGDAYGRDFRYREASSFGRGPRAIAQAGLASAQLLGLVAVGAFAWGRAQLAKRGPAPGEGPSQAQRDKSSFELTVIGEGGGLRADVIIRGGDPGYGETSKMIAEIAVALACDRLPPRYGVLTPVSALEGRLQERLRDAGIGFEVRGPALSSAPSVSAPLQPPAPPAE